MTDEFAQILSRVRATYDKFGYGPPSPASEADIEEARGWFSDRFGEPMPEELVEFWRVSAGIEVSGVALWAPKDWEDQYYVQGVIDTNELYGQDADYDDGSGTRCLIGQRDSTVHYLYNLQNRTWEVVDQFSMVDVFETYGSLAELASHCLGEGLDQEERSLKMALESDGGSEGGDGGV
ncbi:YrhA family protein [Propionibacteriaceae bacterium Y1685]